MSGAWLGSRRRPGSGILLARLFQVEQSDQAATDRLTPDGCPPGREMRVVEVAVEQRTVLRPRAVPHRLDHQSQVGVDERVDEIEKKDAVLLPDIGNAARVVTLVSNPRDLI